MEPAGLIIGVLPILEQIKTTIDNVKALPEACKRLQIDVDAFIKTLEPHKIKLQEHPYPLWLSSLETALEEALETIRVCVSEPFKAKLRASSFNRKIKDARIKIRQSLEHMSVYGVLAIEQQQASLQRLSNNIQDIGDEMKKELHDTNKLIEQVKAAQKDSQEDILLKIAKENGLHSILELLKQIQEYEKEIQECKQEVKIMKDHLEEQDIETAKLVSKSVNDYDSSCPDGYKCPITHEIMVEPLMFVQSGHTYESTALYEALSKKPNVDPVTNKKFEGEPQLVINYNLKKSISEWKEKHPAHKSISDQNPPAIISHTNISIEKEEELKSAHQAEITISNQDHIKQRSKRNLLTKRKLIAWAAFGLAAVIIVVVTILTTKSKDSTIPSFRPSMNPSFRPSTIPSFKPSIKLSSKPSVYPSPSPTFKPSQSPSTLNNSSCKLECKKTPTSFICGAGC